MLADKGLVISLFLATHKVVIRGRELMIQVILLSRSLLTADLVSGRLLFTILIFVWLNRIEKLSAFAIFGGYLAGYGLSLIFGFVFRTPAFRMLFIGRPVLDELWVSTSISAVLIAAALIGYFRTTNRSYAATG